MATGSLVRQEESTQEKHHSITPEFQEESTWFLGFLSSLKSFFNRKQYTLLGVQETQDMQVAKLFQGAPAPQTFLKKQWKEEHEEFFFEKNLRNSVGARLTDELPVDAELFQLHDIQSMYPQVHTVFESPNHLEVQIRKEGYAVTLVFFAVDPLYKDHAVFLRQCDVIVKPEGREGLLLFRDAQGQTMVCPRMSKTDIMELFKKVQKMLSE